MGYRKMKVTSLKQKHIYALVSRWLSEDIQPTTIRNRMSHLRWLAQKIGKSNIVLSNTHYGIPKVNGDHDFSKARELDEDQFFPLGDNSAASKDARIWNTGNQKAPGNFVERRMLLGKAVFIYWPHPRNTPVPFTPNVSQMGLIR